MKEGIRLNLILFGVNVTNFFLLLLSTSFFFSIYLYMRTQGNT